MPKVQNLGYIINEGISVESDANIIADNGRRAKAEGILQDTDIKNRNGRIYLKEDIKPEIMSPRMTELIETGNMCGEEGHPVGADANSLSRQQTIDPKLVSVRFTKIWMEGNLIKGHFMGTNTPYGEVFNQDLLDGFKPSFSLRALGTIESKGANCYVRNIKIITWDRVIFPSHKKAYTTGLIKESAHCDINEVSSSIEKRKCYCTNEAGLLVPIYNDDVISYIKQESANIHSILENFDVFYETMELVNNGSQVRMVSKDGDVMIISLENKIQRDIYDYCSSI